MKHFTRIDFPPERPTPTVYGVRVLVIGSAAGIFVVTTPMGDRTFGGPLHGQVLTEYATIDDARSVALPTEAAASDDELHIAPVLRFLSPLRCTAIVLHHESANGQHYTIQDFAPSRVIPAGE